MKGSIVKNDILFLKTKRVKSPERGTSASAGIDFFVPTDFPQTALRPGESVNIPSGIKMVIPFGQVGIFFNKSSHGSKGLQVGACVVDADYRGEVHLNVQFQGDEDDQFIIQPGMKLVQMLIQDVSLDSVSEISAHEFSKYEDTERGEGGFGSTGK